MGPLHETSVRVVKKAKAHTHTCKAKKASLWLSSGEATHQTGEAKNVEVSTFVLLALNDILTSASIARTISETFIQSSQKYMISPSDVKKVELSQDSPFRSIHTTISHFTLSQHGTGTAI